MNGLATALLGDLSGAPARERNIVWCHFTDASSRVASTPEQTARLEADAVADLRDALGRYPDDAALRGLIADLRRESPRFAELWESRPVAQRVSDRKTIDHPEVGELTLDCDVLSVQGSDLRLVVYTAPPGSPAASKLALLGAVGLQSF
jgi:hypothetical protein